MSEYFRNASGFIINEATFIEGMSELQYLYQYVARGASYDSKDQYEKPKCHPDTRKQLLNDIHEWIKVPEKETGITFLHGPAGAGKSCIARSVCEQAASEGLLGASFFFWRGSSSLNNECRLITTLAYQLAELNEELRQHILSEVVKNPRIVNMPLEVQFQKLVLDPCSRVTRDSRLHAHAIVIDGLDECIGEETQIGILQMLAKAVRFPGFPLGFFVTSRPELHLQEVLDSKELIFFTNVISLNRISGVLQDIRTILESGFNCILNTQRFKRAFKSVSRPWPTAESIEKIVHDSSGQFIYAETVLKFVSDPDDNPVSQLDIILRIQESESASAEYPLANLDRLYHQIMSGIRHPELTTKVLSYIIAIKDLSRRNIITKGTRGKRLMFSYDITRAVLHNQNRLLIVIEQLLGLSYGMAYHSLNQLHSLISLKVGSESKRRHLEIDFYHKSFQDFMTTKKRSLKYYVNLERSHYEIAQSCLTFMGHPEYETEDQHVGWLYSCFQWNVHARVLGQRKVDISKFDLELHRFFFQSQNYIKQSKLNEALQTLGILESALPYRAEWEAFRKMQNDGSFSWEFLALIVTYVRYSFKREEDQVKFDKSYTFPIGRKFLHAYNNDAQIKQLLIFYSVMRYKYAEGIPECDHSKIIKVMGLISVETQQIFTISQYTYLMRMVDRFFWPSKIEDFLVTAEFSGNFYSTPEDFSNVYTAIVSSGMWRDYLTYLCYQWGNFMPKVPATDPLLACLKSEALEFRDDIELSMKLNCHIESNLFRFLREKIEGPAEDVISAWEKAFNEAHSLYSDKFFE